jgi:arylsulfatase
LFSADETCDIGTEHGSPVTADYGRVDFTGTVNWVELAFGEDAKEADHYIKPEERLHLAMAIQ